jgi:hypothetical protein
MSSRELYQLVVMGDSEGYCVLPPKIELLSLELLA